MTQFTLHFLGRFQVRAGAKPITDFHSDKARALLAYLAIEPQEHARSVLAALLWPEIGDQYARTNLRNTLHRLRQTLDTAAPGAADQLLTVTRQTVQFNPAGVVVDVHRFQALLDEAGASVARHVAQPEEAVALYQGELLAGFGLPDAAPFEEWLLLRREQLQQQALLLFHRLVTAYETAGHDDRAYAVANRLLTLDPYREESYRQIMRLLARLGQPDQALHTLEQLRRVLRVEMGANPAVETVALVQQIAAGAYDKMTAWQDDKIRVALPINLSSPPPATAALDLHDVPDPGLFFGRVAERQQIAQWLLHERCRVMAILGIGGLGKTTLAAQVIRELANAETRPFDTVIWRSLINAPPLREVLLPLLQLLSDQQLAVLPESLDEQLRLLIGYLRDKCVLLVLDNMESILEPKAAGAYRPGYEHYDQLIQQVATVEHQSHLLLTSRERPNRYERLERDSDRIRSLQLVGLDEAAGHQLLASRGVAGTSADEAALTRRYSGNPLALKLVADTAQDLFFGDLSEFLAEDPLIFDDVRRILAQQFARLSTLEQEVLFWLAIMREPVAPPTLRAHLRQLPGGRSLLEALNNLQRRSLIERQDDGFALQNVIAEYLTDRLVERSLEELAAGELDLLHRLPLMMAQAKEYVRLSQVRLIVQPVAKQIVDHLPIRKIKRRCQQWLDRLRDRGPRLPSYAAGNLLNLLLHLGVDLTGYDFSHLNLWQLCLQGLNLSAVDLTGADLTGASFSDIFDAVCSVAYSPDGELIAIGTHSGEIRVWQTTDHILVAILQGHVDAVWAIAFSPDSQLLASGSGDQRVHLWDVRKSKMRHTLLGHARSVAAVAFSPDGMLLASGSGDRTVCVWDVQMGTLRQRLDQTGWVVTLAFSPQVNGADHLLASGGADRVIQLWALSPIASVDGATGVTNDVANGVAPGAGGQQLPDSARLIRSLQGHADWIRSLAFSPDGSTLVSGSYDQTIRLWDVETGQERRILTGHANRVLTVAFAPDGQLVASAGRDRTVRLWHVETGRLLRTLLGHTDLVRAVAFSPDSALLVSGGYDQKLCFWSTITGQLERMTQGYCDPVWSINFSPDGKTLVSTNMDQVRLWDISTELDPSISTELNPSVATGRLWQILRGHTGRVRCAIFGPTLENAKKLLASGGYDTTIRLWELPANVHDTSSGTNLPSGANFSAPLCHPLSGHTDTIRSIAFSPDGKFLATGSDDSTVRIWHLSAGLNRYATGGLPYTVLRGHHDRVSSIAFSPYGEALPLLLASAGSDQSICLWEVSPPLAEFTPGARVETPLASVAATSQRPNGRLCAILREPVVGNRMIAFRPYKEGARPLLASGSYDGAIRLWDLSPIFQPEKTPASTLGEIDLSSQERRDLTGQIQIWRIFQMDVGRIRCLAFSPDGQRLVIGGSGRNIYVWDVASGQVRQTLVGHTDWVLSVVFQPQPDPARPILASSSADETIKLWDLQSGVCLQTLRPPGPYAGMKITGVTGISDAQRAALKALGAVE